MHFFIDVCLKENVAYEGNEIEGKEAMNEQECQGFCLSNPTCIGFTWLRADQSCSLKDKITDQVDRVNVISGPPSCGKHPVQIRGRNTGVEIY